MASASADDHASYWAGNPIMESETRKYMRTAMELIDGGIFRNGSRHPWMDRPHESKVLLFEFTGTHLTGDQPTHFETPRDLLLHFEEPPRDERPAKTQRQLIILEDMDPRFVELLGVKLKIPPVFFLAHCEEHVSLSVVDKTCAKQNCSKYWRVPVPQIRMIPRKAEGHGRYSIETGNIARWTADIGENTVTMSYRSHVSYWGHTYGVDSWTAVLLVDPQHTRMQPIEGDATDRSREVIWLEKYQPLRKFFSQVMIDPPSDDISQSFTMTPVYEKCIFDFLQESHNMFTITHTSDPFLATVYARNFIRATWEEYIYRTSLEVHDTLLEDRIPAHHHFHREDGSMGDQDNILQGYQRLIEIRSDVRRDRKILKSIIWAFRSRDPTYRRQRETQETTMPAENVGEEANTKRGKRRTMETVGQIEQESELWSYLDQRLEMIEADVSHLMEGYSQRASLSQSFISNEQSLTANRLARSAGQLTKIATVVVPCAFVASIFSMGGKFAAGESLFGVYWAISIPATLVLLSWVLYKDIQDFLKAHVWNNGIKRGSNEKASKSGVPGPKMTWWRVSHLRSGKNVLADEEKVNKASSSS